MDAQSSAWQPQPDDFPNRLLTGPAAPLPRRYGLLALLLLACLVPRAWRAAQWDLLLTDSVTFHQASVALEEGRFSDAFRERGLNVYLLVLWAFRAAGLDWIEAGKWWGVLVSTATVLPLFGWLRRQFDDRVAVVGSLLYAVHGKLVGHSCLVIRDPTFWLLFMVSLYFLWRAAVEVRWRWFLAAGAALTLSVHLRSEGWLLLAPLVLWTAFRRPAAAGQRWRLAAGAAVCLAVVPASLAAVNLAWLRDCPQWNLLRAEHVEILRQWLNGDPDDATRRDSRPAQSPAPAPTLAIAPTVPLAVPAAVAATPAGELRSAAEGATAGLPAVPQEALLGKPAVAPDSRAPSTPHFAVLLATAAETDGPAEVDFDVVSAAPHVSLAVQARKLVVQLVKAYTYVYALLAVVGVAAYWRVYFRRDHQTLLLLVLLLLAMIWVRATEHRNDVRYFLPAVLVSFPWIALGWLAILAAAQQRCRGWAAGRRGRRAVVAGALAAAVVVSSAFEVRLSWLRFMESHQALGRWIAAERGPHRTIAANVADLRLVQFYSQAQVVGRFQTRRAAGEPLPAAIAAQWPELVLIWCEPGNAAPHERFAADVLDGCPSYRRVPAADLPAACNDVIVLVRDQPGGTP